MCRRTGTYVELETFPAERIAQDNPLSRVENGVEHDSISGVLWVVPMLLWMATEAGVPVIGND